jgi:hypothetical protein
MKTSRAVTKLGLILVTIATFMVANYPRIAVWLANAGDWLSSIGVKLACHGH